MNYETEFAYINIDLPPETPPREGISTPVPDYLPEGWTIEKFDADWIKFHEAIDAVFGDEASEAKLFVTKIAEKDLLEKPESIDEFIGFLHDEQGKPKILPKSNPKTTKLPTDEIHDITYHEVDPDYRDSGLSLKGEAPVAVAPEDYETGHIDDDPLSFDHFNFKREEPVIEDFADVIPEPISEIEMEMLTLAERNLGLAKKIAIFFGVKRGLTTEEAYQFLVNETETMHSILDEKELVYPVFTFEPEETQSFDTSDSDVMTEIRTIKTPKISVQASVGKIASNNTGANISVDFTRGGK